MGRPTPPADYCKKLLPVAIDEIASKEPDRPWVSLPHDDWDLAQGFEDVSFAALANAINKVAYAIEAAFGRSSTFETFAYLGVPDVRYYIVQGAAIKTGYKVLLSSPLNSTNVQVSVMEKTDCVAILSALGVLVEDILGVRPVKHALIAELDDLLDLGERVPSYPFNKTWEDGKLDPYMIIHSRHRALATSDIADYLKYANVTKAAMTPWMMESLAREPDAQRYIEPFDTVLFGGAILSSFASSIWAKYAHIQNGWGCTEAMSPGLLKADREDHAYVYFDTVHTGIEFRESPVEIFEEGIRVPVYEIVLTMSEETAPYASWHVRQGITPENTKGPYPEFRPGDLWTPHPDPAKASYVFKFVGRTDDTFTLSSASNIHPGPIERAISAHPKASGVMIVGNQRRQALALIEVADGVEPSGGAADEIWESVIKNANDNMPAHATITRTHVLMVAPGCLVRTPVGKVNPTNRWLDFTATHVNQSLEVHFSGLLLPWHRHFLYLLEHAMKADCGYPQHLGIPYWDYPLYPSLADSPMFDGSHTSLGSNGSATDLCIERGPFSNTTITFGPFPPASFGMVQPDNWTKSNPHCMQRNLNDDSLQVFNNQSNIDALLASPDITTVLRWFNSKALLFGFTEKGIHGGGHFSIGGTTGDFFASAQDPSFYLHHSMVDRLWALWQDGHPDLRYTYNGTGTIFNPPGVTPEVDNSTVMTFGTVGDPITVSEIADVMSGAPYCYVYL
ncbi:hypothetical protein VMCG_08113 [Cytospora schulzeri]|uniref:Tyrosinase copper-binding domain-containing protein n=1 Tax=Cytospora schulzeri TaxID=448051 RepID=A0A423VRG5_9PEZI|nr:hypothetical protein VMCG_08113 [Valsa malicola]